MEQLVAQLVGVSKVFGATVAARDICLDLRAGEVLALVGENGAGKSTCVKMLGGNYQPDAGTVRIAGNDVALSSPMAAAKLGIAVVHQHPGLFPDLSIAENLFAGNMPTTAARMVDHASTQRQAQHWIDVLGLGYSPKTLVGQLSTSEQQLVEIAKALSTQAKVLVLDEPTAALTVSEVERLFAIVCRLREEGTAILFVGHRLEEIFAISDRITVLRDGSVIANHMTSEISQAECVNLMVGRELDQLYPERHNEPGEVVLKTKALSRQGEFGDIDMEIRAGEIVGIAGLVGSGRTELARTLFGISKPSSGSILIDGTERRIRNPRAAMDLGIAYVSEDRRGQSIIEDFSIINNATLPDIAETTVGGFIQRSKEEALVVSPLERMRLKFADLDHPISELSGGNQQKVVLAKWLAMQPKVLILDEPTQGIDIQAKSQVHKIIAELAEQGMAIVMISSDMPELLGVCDRIAVMRHGRIVAEFDKGEATQYRIGLAATGVEDPGANQPAVEGAVLHQQESAARAGKQIAKLGQEVPHLRANNSSWISSLFRRRESALIAAVLILLAPFMILNPRMLSVRNMTDIAIAAVLIGIGAIGEFVVILTRNIDLSVSSTIGLTAYIAAWAVSTHPQLHPLVIVLLAALMGLGCGVINGLCVSYGHVPAIVVTLGTLAIYRGVDALLSSGKQIPASAVPEKWLAFTSGTIFGIPMLIVVGVVIFGIAAFCLRYLRVGRQMYAVGSNPAGALLLGIPIKRVTFMAFAISGLLAGLAGALWASHYATVDGQMAYGIEMTIIASVVVGGAALRGGSGSILGVVIGTISLLAIQNALALAKVDPQYLQAVYGAAILVAISADLFFFRRTQNKRKVLA